MKIDRLIGILAILLQQEKVTAPVLAEKFEVSRRTISRDIEAICKAGIPIVTTQGQNGGISIMEGYRIDRTLLTSSDMQAILAGLRSLDSVSGTNRYQQLMDKLCVDNSGLPISEHHILIDLSSWYKDSLTPKIELIQEAISRCQCIVFDYCAPKGESRRQIEPYQLMFQWSSWYVWGYCLEKEGFRLFKLNRMTELKNTCCLFEPRKMPLPEVSAERIFPASIWVKVCLEPEVKWRLVDEFGIDSFTEQPDGKLLLSQWFCEKESLFGWLLSFGENAELLEPEELREELAVHLQKISRKYK